MEQNINDKKLTKKDYVIAIMGLILVTGLYFQANKTNSKATELINQPISLEERILPQTGVVLPITWGDLGYQMVQNGVINASEFESLYQNTGGLNKEELEILYGEKNENIKITRENSGFLLNMFWAFGLSNKNRILEEGDMVNEEYSDYTGRFASTGGWTLAVGAPMNHYSKYKFVVFTEEQQRKVENVAKGIYRSCCDNSTYFPDCNHGMAMLGLLELMASEGLNEDEMFDIALKVNSFWFAETYMTLASYFEQRGIDWNEVDPKLVLGKDYSSSMGYQRILQEIKPVQIQGAGGCSVG